MLLEKLRKHTRFSAEKLEHFATTASKRYKSYEIAKRTGGTRLIEHPSREIKAIQRWLNQALISKFPVHVCATAYKKDHSIRLNALRHLGSNFTLRLDFKDFFPFIYRK
jgi:RNA-directed DNA polymerase